MCSHLVLYLHIVLLHCNAAYRENLKLFWKNGLKNLKKNKILQIMRNLNDFVLSLTPTWPFVDLIKLFLTIFYQNKLDRLLVAIFFSPAYLT